jgi:hypothetical protein
MYKEKHMQPVPGFDGYFLDDSLRVISRHGRPLATFRDKDGYLRVSLATERGKDARRIHRGVHQIVCAAFHGPCPDGMQVRHLDGDKANNAPSNLCYSTVLVNNRDRIEHGTVPRGSKHGMAKLDENKVREIRSLIRLGQAGNLHYPDGAIGELFNVSGSTVRLIRINRIWRHVNVAA